MAFPSGAWHQIQRVNVLLGRSMVRAIDNYRRRLPALPNRSEAIRELLELALKSRRTGAKNSA